MDKWNNIPIPLKQSTEVFQKAFMNVSNVIRELIKENQKKTECVVRKFQIVDKADKRQRNKNEQKFQ